MREIVLTTPRGDAFRIQVAETRAERRRWLLGRSGLAADAGLLFPRCRTVHSVGMRFSIRIAWLDRNLHVVATRILHPWRVTRPRLSGRHVLELRVDAPVRVGDRLEGPRPGAVDRGRYTPVLPLSREDGPGPHRPAA